ARGDYPLHVAAFIEAGIVDRDIRMVALVAGSMLELHVRELAGDIIGRIHETEGRREDDVAAGAGEPLQSPLCIGAFRNVLQIGGLDLVAIFGLHRQPSLIVLIGPAEIADRTDIDETCLGLGLRRPERQGQRGSRYRSGENGFLHREPPFDHRAFSSDPARRVVPAKPECSSWSTADSSRSAREPGWWQDRAAPTGT